MKSAPSSPLPLMSTFRLVNAAPLALLADPPMPWHASFKLAPGAALSLYAAGLGFRVEGLSFKVWGLEFRVSGLWALVGFRVAAFRNNAPQPGRGGRREAFKIRCIQNKYTQHLQTCVCVCIYIYICTDIFVCFVCVCLMRRAPQEQPCK